MTHNEQSPQERLELLERQVAVHTAQHGGDRQTLQNLIFAALEDPVTLVRERAIALAARYLEPDVLGTLVADDANDVFRNAALDALTRQGPYAVPHLKRMIHDENPEVGMFAVHILSRIQDSSTVPVLLPLLEHSDPNVAQAVIETLGHLRSNEAVPGLIRLLSADLWLQFAAITALGEIADRRAAKPLLALLSNEMLSEVAIKALANLADPDLLPQLLEYLIGEDRLPLRDHLLMAVAAIISKHPESVASCAAFARRINESPDGDGIRAYLRSILRGQIQSKNSDEPEMHPSHNDDRANSRHATDLLRAAITLIVGTDSDALFPDMLRCAADSELSAFLKETLARPSLSPAIRHASTFVAHPEAAVRRGALLSGFFAPSALETRVAECLSDSDPAVRLAACQVLGDCQFDPAVPNLIKLMQEGSSDEQTAAEEALGRMRPESLKPLRALLDPDASHDLALQALRIQDSAHTAVALEPIRRLVGSPDPTVRQLALRVLSYASDDESKRMVLEALRDPDEHVRIEAVELIVRNQMSEAIPILLGFLAVDDGLRYYVIRALGGLCATDAAASLERLFSSARDYERVEIVLSLIRISGPKALPFLRDHASDPDPEVKRVVIHGIAELAGPDQLDFLLVLAEDSDWYTRNEVAWGLGRLAHPKGRAALLELVRDVEPVVARTARTALEKLP